jgi:alanine-glyoxylate transaminase / serine-glyoxylate transaminase / serine-pyruvate transaminase
MVRHLKLFTPGPGDVDEEVLDALATPVLRHYGPDWMEIYNDTLSLIRRFFNTQNDVFMTPGPSSALLDMGIGSLVATGQKIVIGSNGYFGERFMDIARGYGAEIVPFTAEQGCPLDPEDLRRVLRENPDAQVVAFVHHETGTTVLNPLRELAQAAHEAGRVTVVDTVSSLGGVEVQVDDWGIDVCVTASNKCLESIPGISFISVSPRAWDLVDRSPHKNHGWYLDLGTWRKYRQEWGSWHPTPVTMPSNTVLAVRASMQCIVDSGIEAHFAAYRSASQAVRTGLEQLGFEMFVPAAYAAPVATAVKARPEFEIAEYSGWLAKERGIAIGGGLGPLSGKIFRVGNLGKASRREYLLDFLYATEEFLRSKGLEVPVGASLVGL